ncbi:hypothetical protein K8R66_02035 [bacterium]|nr:hypothetical protein [bacterium]
MSKIKKISIIILILLLIYIIWLFLGPLKTIYATGQDIEINIKLIEKNINADDFLSANTYINQTENDIVIIKKNLQHLNFLQFIPMINEEFNNLKETLDNTKSICNNSSEIIESLSKYGLVNKQSIISNLAKYKKEIKNLDQDFNNLIEKSFVCF